MLPSGQCEHCNMAHGYTNTQIRDSLRIFFLKVVLRAKPQALLLLCGFFLIRAMGQSTYCYTCITFIMSTV